MTNYSSGGAPEVRVSAGTAVKIGFFGALGGLLFSVVLSIIGILIVVVLAALGLGAGLWGRFAN